jgi:hypothetical protein
MPGDMDANAVSRDGDSHEAPSATLHTPVIMAECQQSGPDRQSQVFRSFAWVAVTENL